MSVRQSEVSPIRTVIFDFFGTLACGQNGAASGFSDVFAAHGYVLPEALEAAYVARYDGIEHVEHSVDAERYDSWARLRLSSLARQCGVAEGAVPALVDALRSEDRSPMTGYADAAPTLRGLRERGFRLGICSNWGWDLEQSVDEAGLGALTDVVVTSAQAGARKPHPMIFASVCDALAVVPEEVLFVGDSILPDVYGPIVCGMRAAHIWRPERGPAPSEPILPPGTLRITTLSELLGSSHLDQDPGLVDQN